MANKISSMPKISKALVANNQSTRENESKHDKTSKMTCQLSETQINMGIHQVWSVFAVRLKKVWILSYQKKRTAKAIIRLLARLLMLIRVFEERTCNFAGFAELQLRDQNKINEPRHDKTNKVTVRPAKTQISLGIHPVWSESSLCT